MRFVTGQGHATTLDCLSWLTTKNNPLAHLLKNSKEEFASGMYLVRAPQKRSL